MKHLRCGIALSLAALAITAGSGCVYVKEKSHTGHEVSAFAVVAPPGDTVTSFEVTNTASGNQLVEVNVTAPGTNQPGFWAGLTAPGPKVYRVFHETWLDASAGGGTFVFSDPAAAGLNFGHTNQTALGGSRSTSIGQIQSTTTTNDVAAITAAGAAAGNVIGAAASKAAGKP